MMNIIKTKKDLIFTALLGLLTALAVSFSSIAAPAYLKAVTYTGDAWAINFWNSEMDHLDEDMAQIAADGFNCIILVVPWREFQPGEGTYNDYAFQNLDRVMNAAEAHGLWVQMRISYRWDYYNGTDFADNFRKVIYDDSTRAVWRSYIERIYQAASAHPNFCGGFICWEDFWDAALEAMSLSSEDERLEWAARLGYQDYLRDHYTLEEINSVYGTDDITAYESVPLPPKVDHLSARLFYDFYDQRLLELLQIGQEVFPNLSMEVRLDSDALDNGQGQLIAAEHYKTFGCLNSTYTSLVYSVYMGATTGEHYITAAQALNNMRTMLDLVKSKNGGKPIFIDQFLYMDNTEGFEDNSQVYPEELPSFLTQAASVLRSYTCGYGIWAYRNYRNNILYNNGFGLGSSGWVMNSSARISDRNGSKAAHLNPYGTISQRITHGREGMLTHENYVAFTADSDSPVTVTVRLGGSSQTVEVDGRQSFELNFGKLEYDEISFTSNGEAWIDDVYVYNFVQDAQLYDLDNNELSCISAIRTLNSQLN